MYSSQMGNGFQQQMAQRMARSRRPPPPDLPNGRPAWMQGDMHRNPGGFTMDQEGMLKNIQGMNAQDNGRQAALKQIYDFMDIYGKDLSPEQRMFVQKRAREIRNAFYADRNRNRVHGTMTEQRPTGPGDYVPTPRF